MLNTYELTGVGNPIIDILAQVPDSFLEIVGGGKGGMVLTDGGSMAEWISQLPGAYTQAPGGSSGNTIFAASRLGLKTTFIGKVGKGQGGDFYKNSLKQLGGDISHFKTGEVSNGRCLSLITPDGERTMRTHLGAAATLSPEEVTPADFIGSSHVHVEGYLLFNRDLMMAVLNSAREANCHISLDLASFEVVEAAKDILPALLRDYVHMVFANEEEAATFVGRPMELEEMALELSGYCDLAVVKAGAKGAWLAREGDTLLAPAIPGIKAIDTTGAGDYWAAGFLTGWIRGKPLDVCAEWGARLGAEIVQVIGADLPEEKWQQIIADIR